MYKDLEKKLNSEQREKWTVWAEKWKGKKWTNERFDEGLAIVHPGYERVGNVTSAHKKVKVRCSKGHLFEISPDAALNIGAGCKQCFQKRRIGDAETEAEIIKEKTGYIMNVDTFTGVHKPAVFSCPNGNEFKGTPNHVKHGMRKCQCKPCKESRPRSKRRNKQQIIKDLKARGFIVKSEDYLGMQKKTKIWCIEGEHWTEQKPHSILNLNYGCSTCSGNKKYTIDEINEILKEDGYRLGPDAEYSNNKTPIPLICPEGHEFEASLHNFKNLGRRCPICRIESISGESSHLYNHELTDKDRVEMAEARLDSRYHQARQESRNRDGWKCQCCGMTAEEMLEKGEFGAQQYPNGHHLFSFKNYKDARYVLDNWLTLCYWCHYDFHGIYGQDGHSTGHQFIEYATKKGLSVDLISDIKERINRLEEGGFLDCATDCEKKKDPA